MLHYIIRVYDRDGEVIETVSDCHLPVTPVTSLHSLGLTPASSHTPFPVGTVRITLDIALPR